MLAPSEPTKLDAKSNTNFAFDFDVRRFDVMTATSDRVAIIVATDAVRSRLESQLVISGSKTGWRHSPHKGTR